ncbi:hypothetical protein F2Q69_00007904 [Brassica cretica]|uniref:Uncharacterized protein n=1 Tax=Brassica cretica TaxID=69181 RepID=A0A8S9P938_BRACR|nr:hypothetical protein F2Q69_00007904 [Brassica cretica]
MGHAGLQELLLEHVSPHSRPGRIVRSNVIRAQEKTIDPSFLVAVVIVALAAVSSEELVDSLIAVLVSAPFSILFH